MLAGFARSGSQSHAPSKKSQIRQCVRADRTVQTVTGGRGAVGMHHCALENITVFSSAQN